VYGLINPAPGRLPAILSLRFESRSRNRRCGKCWIGLIAVSDLAYAKFHRATDLHRRGCFERNARRSERCRRPRSARRRAHSTSKAFCDVTSKSRHRPARLLRPLRIKSTSHRMGSACPLLRRNFKSDESCSGHWSQWPKRDHRMSAFGGKADARPERRK
jgi:hypothetical protein